jgi:hypothetical protein
MNRIRVGEALAGLGTVALFLLLFANWFSGPGGVTGSGWSTLGWPVVALLVVVMAVAVVLVVATVTAAKPAIVVDAATISAALGVVVLLIALVRVLITQPDLDLGLGNTAVSVEPAGYLGLVALAAIAAGGWIALADERTDAPESAYTPPPSRPVPGA